MSEQCQFLRYYDANTSKAREVEQLDIMTLAVIASFSSITAASKKIGNGGNISQVCNGKRETSAGFKWRYKNE